ncbi:MAG: Eco57I restriction-modification methylase domain-containing protein [Thermoplasmata archaeon]|nr:Eco57I restriction-modification methylase domain-containing protein [Candidatus Sysuiplasma jiujiangense]
MASVIGGYRSLIDIYAGEHGKNAIELRRIMRQIRDRLYEVLNTYYLSMLSREGNTGKEKFREISKEFGRLNPFHWFVDFNKAIDRSGFDVVLGNPPYIEDRNYSAIEIAIIRCMKRGPKNGGKPSVPLLYASKDCGNTYAYFIERALDLARPEGRMSLIVPVSLVSTDRMGSIRRFVHENSSSAWYYNFDDRPGKIFSGLEHCRSTILVAEKGGRLKRLEVSGYNRWRTADRYKLFNRIRTVPWQADEPGALIPKLGSPLELEILKRLMESSEGKRLGDFCATDGVPIWYHNAPQYWIHAHRDGAVPKVEYYSEYRENDGVITPLNLEDVSISDHYKKLAFPENKADAVIALLCSSIFYWWFTIWSDGRDLLDSHIKQFPLNLDKLSKQDGTELTRLVDELTDSFERHSAEVINVRKKGTKESYVIKIKTINTIDSYDIIRKIDSALFNIIGLNEEQSEFLAKFDLSFRMQKGEGSILEDFTDRPILDREGET